MLPGRSKVAKTLDPTGLAMYNGGENYAVEVIYHKQTVISGGACQASGLHVCVGQTRCPYEV